MITNDDIRDRLEEIRVHGSGKNIISLDMVKNVSFDDGIVSVRIERRPMPPQNLKTMEADLVKAVGAMEGVREVQIGFVDPPGAQAPKRNDGPFGLQSPLPGVDEIIAVSSTKGGVGKSTIATNLALALKRNGKRVGLLDADVYGPSIPIMFGIRERPAMSDDKRILPIEAQGIALMSVGFFLDENSPVVWRGPLVMGLVRQFLRDVDWGRLDALVIDLPPGTGDAALTLLQQVPISGGVIVTTPQDMATLDVGRGIAMFRQVQVPVFGVRRKYELSRMPEVPLSRRSLRQGRR